MKIPNGFEPHFRKSGFTEPWEPLYSYRDGKFFRLGLYIGEAHSNSRGFVHGGLISTLADNTMGLSCAMQFEDIGGLVTVNLNTDFISSGQKGEWIQFDALPIKTGKRLCFAECRVTADNRLIARSNATFNVMNKTDKRRTKDA